MNIELQQLGKRYHRTWIFRKLSHSFKSASSTGVIGANGSGKSTLLKLLSASELPSEGEVLYRLENNEIDHNVFYKHLSYAAPYIDLAEELTCTELVDFHLKFKSFQKDISSKEFIDLVYLTGSKQKRIKDFSSGMKQRLKLGLAICTKSDLLLLDEPCSNLDSTGVKMYHQLMDNFNINRTTIIGSNEDSNELYRIENIVRITDFK